MRRSNRSITVVVAILSLVCFVQFCAIIWIGLKGQNLGLPDLSFNDFITVAFTAVTLILSMLAVMIGVLAFIGWQGFHSNVSKLTETLIREGFDEEGEFREVLNEEVFTVFNEGLKEGGSLRAVLKEEIDAIATSGITPIYGEEEQEENE